MASDAAAVALGEDLRQRFAEGNKGKRRFVLLVGSWGRGGLPVCVWFVWESEFRANEEAEERKRDDDDERRVGKSGPCLLASRPKRPPIARG